MTLKESIKILFSFYKLGKITYLHDNLNYNMPRLIWMDPVRPEVNVLNKRIDPNSNSKFILTLFKWAAAEC